VRTLPAEPGKVVTDYYDALLPGLVLRVTPGGARTFAVAYHAGKTGKKHKLGRYPALDLGDAREDATAVMKRLARGLEPKERPALAVTVDQMVAKCLDCIELKPKTLYQWRRLAETEIASGPGPLPAEELERTEVRAWQRRIAKRTGWVSNRAFELLRRAYNWAINEGELRRKDSPCDRLGKVFREPSSKRVLSRDEVRALLTSLTERYRPTGTPLAGPYADAVWLLLYTGVREYAVVGARFADFELDRDPPRWIVPAEQAKRMDGVGDPHLVPLTKEAVAVVRRRKELSGVSAYLFPCGTPRKRKGDVPMVWSSGWVKDLITEVEARLRVDTSNPKATVPRWTIHNLRHTMSTTMTEDLDVDKDVVSLILGHAQEGPKVDRVYNRAVKMPQRKAALEAWASWLERVVSGAKGATVLAFSK